MCLAEARALRTVTRATSETSSPSPVSHHTATHSQHCYITQGRASVIVFPPPLSVKDGVLLWEGVEQNGDLPSAREGATLK